MSDLFHFLRGVPFFASLSDEDISVIRDTCRKTAFKTGEIIFREGDLAEHLFIVYEGSVEIWKNYSTPEQGLLSVYGSGQLFGELALIDDSPRSATVITRQPCELLSITREDFDRITRSNPISKSIMQSLSATIRRRTETFSQGIRIRDRKLEKLYKELKKFQVQNVSDLREREQFVRLTHRQFGNHLRRVSDMMNLQAEYISDTRTLNIFRRSWSRVNTLALVHETISLPPYDIFIEAEEYIKKVVKNIFQTFRIRSGEILVDVEAAEILLHPEEAFPIGLIVNELLAGSFSAAAQDKTFSHIQICLAETEENELELSVSSFSTLMTDETNLSDTGIAAPDLVKSLVENCLGGRLRIESNGHTRFLIRFLPKKIMKGD
ncbi:MAG: cyclic nucleotide-binding domain-containing protein [Desulfobacterales bacterium]